MSGVSCALCGASCAMCCVLCVVYDMPCAVCCVWWTMLTSMCHVSIMYHASRAAMLIYMTHVYVNSQLCYVMLLYIS